MSGVAILALLALVPLVLGNECPNPLYKRFSTQHTGCKSYNKECTFYKVGWCALQAAS